jgi:hypothetical protein
LCPFNRLTRLILGVIVKDSPCSKHVDTGISPESAPDRSELLTISPNLDESVDAVRAFQKRQVGLISKTLLLPVIQTLAAFGLKDQFGQEIIRSSCQGCTRDSKWL